MRKISMTTSYFMNFGDEPDGFKKMRETGFDACDYSAITDPDGEIFKLSETERLRVLEKARENAVKAGVEIYQAHGPWVWPTRNDTVEGRKWWADAMRKDLDVCKALGCKNLVVHPVMPYANDPGQDTESFLRINREFWSDMLEHCEKTGVALLLENMPFLNQVLSPSAPMAQFVRSFDTDLFAMCLDTGHGMICSEKPGDSVRVIGDLLRGFHVHDNDGKNDRHDCPYLGIADWEDFREAVRDVPESVPLSLECTTKKIPDELRDDFLRGYAKIAQYLAN